MHSQTLTLPPVAQRASLDLSRLEGSISRLVQQRNALRQRLQELHAENDDLRGRALKAERKLTELAASIHGGLNR
jgi:chromosome segregation ATPase